MVVIHSSDGCNTSDDVRATCSFLQHAILEFDPTTMIPCDVMHDALEGVIPIAITGIKVFDTRHPESANC